MRALARSWPSSPRKRNIVDGTQAKKLILLDGAYNLSRHITVISSNQFRMSISNDIQKFDGTRQPDNATQTDIAPAPVDEYVAPPPAATYAATASLSAPLPQANLDVSGLVNPQFSTSCVEACAPKVIGSLIFAPVSQTYQEQTVAGEKTQNIVEQSLHVPLHRSWSR